MCFEARCSVDGQAMGKTFRIIQNHELSETLILDFLLASSSGNSGYSVGNWPALNRNGGTDMFLHRKIVCLFLVCLCWRCLRLCGHGFYALSESLISCRAQRCRLPSLRIYFRNPVCFIKSWKTSPTILSRSSRWFFQSTSWSGMFFRLKLPSRVLCEPAM